MSEEKKQSKAGASVEAVAAMCRKHGWPEPKPCEGHGSIVILRPNKPDKNNQ